MFISSPFNPDRHPTTRINVCANECAGSWSGMLSVTTRGIDINVYLNVEDIEALSIACAETLRKVTEAQINALTEEAA